MTDIEVLEREKQCVQRKTEINCSDCAHCDLLMDDAVILAAYDRAISALRAQQERENPKHSSALKQRKNVLRMQSNIFGGCQNEQN